MAIIDSSSTGSIIFSSMPKPAELNSQNDMKVVSAYLSEVEARSKDLSEILKAYNINLEKNLKFKIFLRGFFSGLLLQFFYLPL